MSKFGMISATLVATLCALGLSVGAALAEGETPPAKAGQAAPRGICFLHDL